MIVMSGAFPIFPTFIAILYNIYCQVYGKRDCALERSEGILSVYTAVSLVLMVKLF